MVSIAPIPANRDPNLLVARFLRAGLVALLWWHTGPFAQSTSAQERTLEQRQPLELVYADSIVPQDRHETMLTTGGWFFRHGVIHEALLTEKVEWGISDRLQISTFVQMLHSSNVSGSREVGIGDFQLSSRYTWPKVGSPFTHVAVALDAEFPTGNPRKGLGDAAYAMSPSVLLSHEFQEGKYQLFSTDGVEFILSHRKLLVQRDEPPHHSAFFNSGLSYRAGHGWAVAEVSVNTDRWGGGTETNVAITPTYVWRILKRTELLVGIPIGLTSSSDRIGGVVKFTFEMGGDGP